MLTNWQQRLQQLTYCPRLWRELFIYEDGNVYACCHEQPRKLGNIYQQSLREIYHSSTMARMRKRSLQAHLHCYPTCNLLRAGEFANPVYDIDSSYRNLQRLKIQFGQDCNISCIMCYQNKRKLGNRQLQAEALQRHVDLTPFSVIDIQGGEPLFLSQARHYIDHIIAEKKHFALLSNGVILTPDWARKIVDHSPAYHVSINAATATTHEIVNRGSSWARVLANLETLATLRKQRQSQLQLKGHFTIIPENQHEIPDFIASFTNLGFDHIDFGYDWKFPAWLRLRPVLRKRLQQATQEAYANSPFKPAIDSLRLVHLGLLQKPQVSAEADI
jgi:radical SAM protein with 4Fe4S-binding SPASM domain